MALPPFTYRNHLDSLRHRPRIQALGTADKHCPHAVAAQNSTPDTASDPAEPDSTTAEELFRRHSVAGKEDPAGKAFDVVVAVAVVVDMTVAVVEGGTETAEVAQALVVHRRRACRWMGSTRCSLDAVVAAADTLEDGRLLGSRTKKYRVLEDCRRSTAVGDRMDLMTEVLET